MKKIETLLFLFLSFASGLLVAQSNFKPGYIITTTSDTVYGTIDYRGDLIMGQVCKFRPGGKGKYDRYTPFDIIAFRFIEGKYYVSKEYKGNHYFLEFLINGIVKIYFLRTIDTDYYLMEKDGHNLTEIPYEESYRNNGNTRYRYRSNTHYGILNYYMNDAPDFYSRIMDINKPTHQNLIRLAEDYHYKVCDEETCVIYEKKIPLFKVNLELSRGPISFNGYNWNYLYFNSYIDQNYINSGILAHFWLPRANENFYLRTGIYLARLEFARYKSNLYKIPLHCEYIYPKGIIRPKAAYGISLYQPFNQSVSFMGGVNIKIYKPLFLSFNYEFDYTSREVFLLPQFFISKYFSTGIYVDLQ
jgi:hypothetical protein